MSFTVINPESLGRPKGYANGLLTTPDTRLLFIAGQIGWDERQRLVGDDFVEQFDRALRNVLAVVSAAGGAPGGVARLTVYVTDKEEYRARTAEIGERWRALMGRHYPTMALVEVKGLLEDGAKVEIEGIAVL
jgi:enamine deaminase RidA (YjgF/YER057c/UK114 family)